MQTISFQEIVAVSGTPQQLPSNPVLRSVTVTAPATNSADIVIGSSRNVTLSTGYALEKGQSVTIPLHNGNTDAAWIVGTAGDVLSVVGA